MEYINKKNYNGDKIVLQQLVCEAELYIVTKGDEKYKLFLLQDGKQAIKRGESKNLETLLDRIPE